MIKGRRCDECKRRRKRCTGSGKICDLCSKKGLECNNFGFQVVEFNGPENRIVKPEITPRRPNTKSPSPEPIIELPLQKKSSFSLSSPSSSSNSSLSIELPREGSKITSSSLISLIKENLVTSSLGINIGTTSAIHLPSIRLDRSHPIPFLQDFTTERFFDNEVTIPKEFSLIDFLLSSSRVDFMDLYSQHSNQAVDFDDIDKFLKLMKGNKTLQDLQQDGYSIHERNDQFIVKTKKFKSLSDVKFRLDLENLKTNFFLQRASIDDEHKKDDHSATSFANLPEFIDPIYANVLFHKFCDITQDAGVRQGDSLHMVKDSVKVNFLKVCFPLIFGNITVLKSVLIVSYYHWKNQEPRNDLLMKMESCIEMLHLSVADELQQRLTNCFSICCDHTLLSVLLLLSTEVIRGLRGPLWRRLFKLIKEMIILRGGVPSLLESLTGLCLIKLLSVHLSVGGLTAFQSSKDFGDTNQLSFADFNMILDSHRQLDFYDNLNYFIILGLNEIKSVLRVYGHITQLYNLSIVSYDANKRDDKTMDYESVSLENLELVLDEAGHLENSITQGESFDDLPDHYRIQISFAYRVSLLYLFQMVYRQTSLSPKTVLAVKNFVKDVQEVFEELESLDQDENKKLVVFIMPLFLLGVDLGSSNKRKWFKEKLNHLYKITRKEPLKTCVELLEKVWEVNKTGNVYVDWKLLLLKHDLDICLYC